MIVITTASLLIVITCPIVILADLFWSVHFTKIWMQICTGVVGILLLASTFLFQIKLFTRCVMFVAALMFITAAIDSLDGKQDILPFVVLLLIVWTAGFVLDTRALMRQQTNKHLLQLAGVSLGLIAITVYAGTAGYYFVLNQVQGPLDYDHHLLFGIGLVISQGLRYIKRRCETIDTQSVLAS